MPEPRIGTDASSGRRWSPPSPDAQALQASIDAAIARGDPSVSLRPDETYYFNSASLNVSSSKGFRLEGNGAKVILALGSSVRVTNARATTIANVVIDYNEEPASQATILFASRGCFSAKAEAVVEASRLNDRVCELLVEVMPNFPPPDPSVRPDLCFWPACETKLIFFEGNRTHRMSSPQVVTWLANSTQVRGRFYTLRTQPLWGHAVRAGDLVAVAGRRCGPCTYQLINGSHVTTENVTIHGSCNMAILERGGAGSNAFRRVRVVRPPRSRRLLSASFDGFHSEGSRVAPLLEDSTFEHIGDDFYNVQDAIQVVLGWTSDGALVVADSSFGSTYSADVRGIGMRLYRPTEDVWVTKQIGPPATIVESHLMGPSEAAPFRERARNISATFKARYGWQLASFEAQAFSIYRLALDGGGAIRAAGGGYGVLAQMNASFGAVVRRNRFLDGLGRAMVMNSLGARVEGNVFSRAMSGGMLVDAEVTWLSGNLGTSRNLSVRDNTFDACCTSPAPFAQCNASASGIARVMYNAAGATGIWTSNNTVDALFTVRSGER